MKYLRTPKSSERLSGVNHRLTIKLPRRWRVKIAVRHWHTFTGHKEVFLKLHVWRDGRELVGPEWDTIPRHVK